MQLEYMQHNLFRCIKYWQDVQKSTFGAVASISLKYLHLRYIYTTPYFTAYEVIGLMSKTEHLRNHNKVAGKQEGLVDIYDLHKVLANCTS